MRMTLEEAQACAQGFIDAHTMCSGCPASTKCGIGAWSARRLAEMLEEIDPTGQNITTLGLTPIGQPPIEGRPAVKVVIE